ncbi:helix-turn-helix transcriptional regulator [Cellulosimicrobium marinum]|uniref:helix-turn-helix transcriptional regulator n=1 Tax=Cellulosimicrobium marinum TaxID=1638992 RepID=UPI001E37B127|nr:helix-turn-helix transcriptional regulator [Cellulosimicrobium marinum]MCB7135515.1 helix-turn-helix transcriptional regulator [Cellulosimicrobium marinum]
MDPAERDDEQHVELGGRTSARVAALRRSRDVLVLDRGDPTAPLPLWVRVREHTRPGVVVRVVVPERHEDDGAPCPAVVHGPPVDLRAAPALPLSLVVVDDTVVLVAGHGRTRAVTDRHSVRALRLLAESVWDGARPAADSLRPDEDLLLRMLADGKTDAAVAARLGVSPRTVRRVAARLMARLGATSRFAAGVRAAHRGWIRTTDR